MNGGSLYIDKFELSVNCKSKLGIKTMVSARKHRRGKKNEF